MKALPADSVLVRVHHARFEPAEFDTPRRLPHGRPVIPTLYASPDAAAAIAEALFHDVPHPQDRPPGSTRSDVARQPGEPGAPRWQDGLRRSEATRRANVPRAALRDRVLSRLRTPRELRLIALDDRALLDAPASAYRTTADAAEALHDATPDADGIAWTSRRFPAHDAFVLFGDRVGILHVVAGPLALDHGPGLDLAEDVAMRAGVGLLL